MSISSLQTQIETAIDLVKHTGYPLARVIDIGRNPNGSTGAIVVIKTSPTSDLLFLVNVENNYIYNVRIRRSNEIRRKRD